MLQSFIEALEIESVGWLDLIEIGVIWFVIYQIFRFLSGTRTKQMAFGLFLLFFVQILADRFDMAVISKTIGSLMSIIPIAILVLFQREIRRMLATIGSNPFVKTGARTSALDNIFQASMTLSKNEVGALIVLEREQGLRDYIEGGTRLDALPSTELLVDIFQPKSILHDGAVIISDSRIASAACLMPLSRNPSLPRRYGTRHRAAIGISEETDAISLVVSEETGRISFCFDGQIYPVKEHNMSTLYETYNSLTTPDQNEGRQVLKNFNIGSLVGRRSAKDSKTESVKQKSKQEALP